MAAFNYPATVRANASKCAKSDFEVVDKLMEMLCRAGGGGKLSVTVQTDNSFYIERQFGEKVENTRSYPSFAEVAMSEAIEGKRERLPLALAVALSSKSKVIISQGTITKIEEYVEGEVHHKRQEMAQAVLQPEFVISFLPDLVELDGGGIYPYRIRAQEYAALFPGVHITLKYKGFAPESFLNTGSPAEMILDSFVKQNARVWPEPFVFKSGDFEVAFHLVRSEMEKLKSFVGTQETYFGGPHEEKFRELFIDALKNSFNYTLPDRRQSLNSIAVSRMTYFGAFNSTVPFLADGVHKLVDTIPGIAACIVYNPPNPRLDAGARLLSPPLPSVVEQEFTAALEYFLLTRAPQVERWFRQWVPKKRKKYKNHRQPHHVSYVWHDEQEGENLNVNDGPGD